MENRIKTRFNQSSNTYDNACSIQQATNANLLKILLNYKNSNDRLHSIADLGCGTGNSTLSLIKKFRYQKLYAIDVAEQLLKIAEKKLITYSVKFIHSSFNHSIELNSLDLVYANMSLHWALDIEKTLNITYKMLKTKGFLSFSIPLSGTLGEINSQHRNIFFSPRTIESIISKTGFSLLSKHQMTFVDKFISPVKALRSIKNVGASSLLQQKKKGLSGKHLYASVFKNKDIFNLTYQIGFFILKK